MQDKEFRYHPLVEGLKVNEDGTEVLLNNTPLKISNYSNGVFVTINKKQVTTMRLVCECWHGLAENGDFVVKKIDESKSAHYSNLTWSKRGQGLSHEFANNFCGKNRLTKEEFLEKNKGRKDGEPIVDFIKRIGMTTTNYYKYLKLYGTKENE